MRKLLILGAMAAIVVSGCTLGQGEKIETLGLEEAKAYAAEFINNNLMQPGNEVSIKEVTDESGLYKVVVNMPEGQEVVSYLTKDGKKFFPQDAIDVAEMKSQNSTDSQAEEGEQTEAEKRQAVASQVQAITADLPKQDKPEVELFVMSHCPYGTQIEKGIIPAIKALGDRVDFELKFCDYAMHGKKELDEQLNQHCIQKNEPEKLLTYLECFLEAGNGEDCLTEANINTSRLASCVQSTDREYEVTELYNDQSTWRNNQFPQFNVNQASVQEYGITGSPGLVVNGVKLQSGRNPATLLGVICAGFEDQPEACAAQLSVDNPSPGFGAGTSGSAAGGCAS